MIEYAPGPMQKYKDCSRSALNLKCDESMQWIHAYFLNTTMLMETAMSAASILAREVIVLVAILAVRRNLF